MTREKMEVHLDRCMAIAASIETLACLVKHCDLVRLEEESPEGTRNISTMLRLLSDGLFESLETVKHEVGRRGMAQGSL